ncbi:hypothetical protein GCM10023332_02540 [Luteimonas vadosa]|uniref:Uncharacterized protein n=2 Tax=Luteimonas vadosa TaxID=1165507 RepID=A0ABP9DQQ4_9GAMM
MLCVWLELSGRVGPSSVLLTMQKTTPREESKNGADLRVNLATEFGLKRCLFQAKVLDPKTGKLRCEGKQGISKLRKQLKAARAECGALAFLLVYVPSQYLDGACGQFSTYEQMSCSAATPGISSTMGATVIPVDALLTPSGKWKKRKEPVGHLAGAFPNGLPFWKVLIELLVCRRGTWAGDPELSMKAASDAEGFITLTMHAEAIDRWDIVKEQAEGLLRAP